MEFTGICNHLVPLKPVNSITDVIFHAQSTFFNILITLEQGVIMRKIADITVLDEEQEIIEKEIKQEWPYVGTLWDTTVNVLPITTGKTDLNALLPVRKVATDQPQAAYTNNLSKMQYPLLPFYSKISKFYSKESHQS